MDPFLPGELSVQLLSGENLKDCDWVGQQDPYVIVSCGNHQYRSNTHLSGGTNPSWNQVFVFKVTRESEIKLVVWDQDNLKADDCIGKATVSLAAVRQAGSRPQEVKVPLKRPLTKRQKGFVHLVLSFIPDSMPGAKGAPDGSQYLLPTACGPQYSAPHHAGPAPQGGNGGRVSSSGVAFQEECPQGAASWYSATGGQTFAPHHADGSQCTGADSFRLEDSDSYHTAYPPAVLPPHQAPPPQQALPHAPSYHHNSSLMHHGAAAPQSYAPQPQPYCSQPPAAADMTYPPVQLGAYGGAAPGYPPDPYSSFYAAPSAGFAAPPGGYAAPPTYPPYGSPAPYGLPPRAPVPGPMLFG